MQRRLLWLLIGLLCIGSVAYFWHATAERRNVKNAPTPSASVAANAGRVSKSRPITPFHLLTQQIAAQGKQPATNANVSRRLEYRLSNTSKTVGQLARSDSGILLANALIDTAGSAKLAIPEHLRAPENNGSFIVQAKGPIDASFRAMLQSAGATIISYVPNNAFLVRLSDAQAGQLSGNSMVQKVLSFEPYYKLDPGLLKLAVEKKSLPDRSALKLTVFPGARGEVLKALAGMGAQVTGEERSPFGPVITAQVGSDSLIELARNSAVQLVETSQPRVSANDLTRVSLRISANTVTNANYLDLSGSNIMVNINDSGVDQFHPDLTNRVFADSLASLTDTDGHGTHVAGTIAGSGIGASMLGTNGFVKAPGSLTNASFRGMAHAAKLYSLTLDSFRGPNSDTYLQEQAALTNAFISNNSWGYVNTFEYSIEAASYDAAVRDALPEKVGSQPVLFVFAAGNNGNGDSGGLSGDADSVLSPGTAKNVITVGALEQERNITNQVGFNGETNAVFLPETDRKDQVAYYSSRGNTGIGVEGEFGRFKPDVVAPGSYLVSARSGQWDTNAYYNPTNFTFDTAANVTVEPGSLVDLPPLFIPANTIGVIIDVFPNRNSASPFPDAPIYLRYGARPTVNNFELTKLDNVSLPEDGLDVRPEENLFFSVGNPTNVTFNFNIEVILVLTNDNGDFYTVLKGLNDDLGPNYRYSSGTSMAAAGVSGMMALMQEFFEQRLHRTNSPALMKALLINGSRSAGSLYGLQVDNFINFQGWGLPSLQYSIPTMLTNLIGQTNIPANNVLPMQFFDQQPTNALATGERKTRNLIPSPSGRARPLRVTLVWTDPPGNPSVGIKLVNDLDLVVTNLSTGDVYFGNDFAAGSDFNQSWDTNGPVKNDFVNNVENVFLPAPLGTNYSITVFGKRVNVNANTGNSNNVVQDYALVISSGNGDVTNAFTITESPLTVTNHQAHVTTATNAVPLFGQRVGGNSQYAGTTDGHLGQWNFYEYTNTNSFTNVAFLTFLPPEIGIPRIGTREMDPLNAGRIEGDVDLFVTTDSSLTNLNPTAIANAFQSHTRSGTETILLTNSSLGQKYYIGVKAEDQQGAEYTFFAAASELPFGQRDPNGNIIVTMLPPFKPEIPDGSPAKPGKITVIGVTTEPDAVRRVIVTNEVTHQGFGDLVGTLNHERKFAVLNNHSVFDVEGDTNQRFIYDDSDQGDITGSRHTDGPGSLRRFVGEKAVGSWILTMVDDSQSSTGRVEFTGITLEPQSPTNNVRVTLGANAYWADFIDVEPGATNLTVTISTPDSLYLMIRRGDFPTLNIFDKKATINPPGGSLSITKFDSPPLNPGRYFILVYNPNQVPVTFNISKTLQYDLTPIQPYRFLSGGSQPILDDAVSYYTNHVGIDSRVVSAEVGVRIDHPRISDLVLTLISPLGTRVLLAENRGQFDTNGYGAGVNITNVLPQFTSGGAAAKTNTIPVTQTAGTLLINYDFLGISDSMHIYYDGVRIFDSGYVNGSGNFVVDFGPGLATDVVVVMNEGNNAAVDTEWSYSLTVITRSASYATFTENTNYTDVPIKFATPPFGSTNAATPAVNLFTSGFDATAPGNYPAPGVVDGWTSANTNPVTVVQAPVLANSGSNVLALHNGAISRVLPTLPGKTYTLSFVTRGKPSPIPISWWKAETNLVDSVDGNDAQVQAGSLSYLPGVVGQAFNMTNAQVRVLGDPVNLRFTNDFSIEGWINCRDLPAPQAILYKSDAAFGLDPYTVTIAPSATPGFGDVTFGVTDASNASDSVTGLFPLNQFAHLGCTFSNGVMSIYVNGALAGQKITAVRPLETMDPFEDPGIGIGNGGDFATSLPFHGLIDEMSLYNQPLSQQTIQSIYAAGSAGKCDLLGGCSVLADVVLSGNNSVIAATDAWVTNNLTFTAVSYGTTFEITPRVDGMLVDSFEFIQHPFANPTNYFFPEESLAKLVGEKSLGDWRLEILDNRAGNTNPEPTLVSWQLNLVLDSLVPAAEPLTHGNTSQTNTVNPNEIKYFIVDVPLWAKFATNQLFNPTGPVNVLFNQSVLPTGTNGGDILLLNNSNGGAVVLDNVGSTPILIPGERYYIGVQNLGATPVTFTFQVDFDITQLINAVPLTHTLPALGEPRYYFYDVSSNAQAVSFELFNANGNVDLVARKGVPLPDLVSHEYISSSLGTSPESIVIVSNSQPVALSPGRWYLGVFNNDILPVNYTIMATEAGPPTIIDLTNGVPFTYTAGPGAGLTNFFRFVIDQTNSAALFELYGLSGDVDLTLKRDTLPYTAPYTGFSFNAGTANEQIVIRSNTLSTDLNGQWFLAVPNRDAATVTYTIRAVVSTNGVLTSGVPPTVQITVPPPATPNGPTITWPTVVGETYQVQTSTDLVNWAVLTTVTASGNIYTYVDTTPAAGILFYRIVQVPGP